MRAYLGLTKPGIIAGNALVALAGFVFAAPSPFPWALLALTLLGLSAVVASACVFNNYADREIDVRMERTKTRALASGALPSSRALLLGTILLIAGVLFLSYTTLLALLLALLGFAVYVFLYTPLKPRSSEALYVGAVAGAIPPVVGYAAAANTLTFSTLLLFLAMYLWQLPHFIAIAYYRFDEYKAAGVPLLIRKEPSVPAKRRARGVFYASLVVLLMGCVGLILQR